MKFIKLTLDSHGGKNDNSNCYIQIDSILAINGNYEENRTMVSYKEMGFLYVKESPNEVYALIRDFKEK